MILYGEAPARPIKLKERLTKTAKLPRFGICSVNNPEEYSTTPQVMWHAIITTGIKKMWGS